MSSSRIKVYWFIIPMWLLTCLPDRRRLLELKPSHLKEAILRKGRIKEMFLCSHSLLFTSVVKNKSFSRAHLLRKEAAKELGILVRQINSPKGRGWLLPNNTLHKHILHLTAKPKSCFSPTNLIGLFTAPGMDSRHLVGQVKVKVQCSLLGDILFPVSQWPLSHLILLPVLMKVW